MANEFEIAIEKLYKTFSKYPLNQRIEGCPCCVSGSDKATLHSKKLRELENGDISRYAFKAMTTWGDVNDFKHYLPRVLELLAKKELVVDTFVVLGKLSYGNWEDWPKSEQDAIKYFLRTWWNYYINQGDICYFDAEIFIEINKLIKDLPWMLSTWSLDVESSGFQRFVELIKDDYHDLIRRKRQFKEFTDDDIDIVEKWIFANSTKLEDGFTFYETKDMDIAVDITTAIFVLESKYQ